MLFLDPGAFAGTLSLTAPVTRSPQEEEAAPVILDSAVVDVIYLASFNVDPFLLAI